MEQKDRLNEIESLLSGLTQGESVGQLLVEDNFEGRYRPLVRCVNKLSEDLADTLRYAQELTSGNLDAEHPDKRVYLSGPFKEIHSQLSSLSYGLQSLSQGNISPKLYYSGELCEWFNKLVDREAERLKTDSVGVEQWSAANSWRYHQVLSAINRLNIMVMQVDVEGAIVFGNPSVFEMFPERRLPYGEDLVEDVPELVRYLAGFAGRVKEGTDLFPGKKEFPVLKELYNSQTGSWYKITSDTIPFVDGSNGILHMIDDISIWKTHEVELTETASTDPLTGAYTRGAGLKRLGELVSNKGPLPTCVVFVDIDGLKKINDVYGHHEGDFAIRSIADVLIAHSREKDWVFRYGGDEFIIVFTGCT
ncbi:MAG: GGDEF domain-containing protein, partial [Oscillospiraceae bacterium]|nr:GGDEF domain-containing protein [Oscillospiraceae bacterium]